MRVLSPLPQKAYRPFEGATSGRTLFGCRLFAAMPSDPQARGIDRFVRSCLTGAGNNSLLEQTRVRDEKDKHLTWEAMVFEGINAEGSGVVAFRPAKGQSPFVYRSPKPTREDRSYKGQVRKASAQPFSTLMAHVRAGPNPVVENNHPFIDRNERWAFMHNGNVPLGALAILRRQVETDDLPLTGERIQGTTDTEVVFNRMLGHMMRRFGTTDPARIDSMQLMRVFSSTLREIIRLSEQLESGADHHALRPHLKSRLEQAGLSVDPDSRIHFLPALNFVISDGNRILASCLRQKLWLSTYRLPDGQSMSFFSSEPVKPAIGRLELQQEIPEGHMAMLEKTPEGVRFRIQGF